MELESERKREISELAEGYADIYFPNSWIDPEQLVHKLNVTLSYNYYGDSFDGLLEWNQKSFHIYCNLKRVESSTSARARFTIGHELGHLIIDEHRLAMMSGTGPCRHPSFAEALDPELRVEAEADLFASNLLMPAARCQKVIPENAPKRTFDQISQVQNTFKVSYLSAALKVIETARLACCACVMWRLDKKPWYRVSTSLQRIGCRRMKLDQNLIHPDSPTSFILGQNEESTQNLPEFGLTRASNWFHNVPINSASDIILRETSVRLGRRGVFTFLSREDL